MYPLCADFTQRYNLRHPSSIELRDCLVVSSVASCELFAYADQYCISRLSTVITEARVCPVGLKTKVAWT